MLVKPEALCLGCLVGGRLVGYLIADMFVDVWHLMNVAVAQPRPPPPRRLRPARAYFELTERNRAPRPHARGARLQRAGAIELYRSYGFVATGVRRGYYSDDREDAVIMWKEWEGDSA